MRIGDLNADKPGSCEDSMALAMAQETDPTTNVLEEAPFGNKLIEA
jgi:hypothetical protein